MSDDANQQPATIGSFDALHGACTDDVLGFNHACVACGYNLRGLAISARCPECNRTVAESLSKRYLHNADRRWVRGMRRGAMLLTINTILPFASFCVFMPFVFLTSTAFTRSGGSSWAGLFLMILIPSAAVLSIWLTYLLGWIWLTKLEPGTQPTTVANAARSKCRSWSIIVAILIPAFILVAIVRLGGGMLMPGAGISPLRDLIEVLLLSLAPSVMLVIQFGYAVRHVRNLCGRLNANGLAVYTLVLFWVVVVISVLGAGRSTLQYYSTRQMMAQITAIAMNQGPFAPVAPGAAPTPPLGNATGGTPQQATATAPGGVPSGIHSHQSVVMSPTGPQFPTKAFGPLFLIAAIVGGIHSLLSIAMYGMYIGFCGWLWAKLAKAAKPKFVAG